MSKDEFLRKYRRPQITIWFNDNVFLSDVQIDIQEAQYKISSLGEFYCPWHYDSNNCLIGSIEQAVGDPAVKSMRIKMSELINLDEERLKVIDLFIKNFPGLNDPIPLATDLNTKKTLILDANKRCVALYRNYLKSEIDNNLEFIEITGTGLEKLIEDFKIINR